MDNPNFYNRQQRDLFMRTFLIDPHKFTDKLIMFSTHKWGLDIMAFDNWLEKDDPDYHPGECCYKKQTNVSMMEYLRIKYGEHICRLVHDLMISNFVPTIYLPVPYETEK
jgi:hypothetical protein